MSESTQLKTVASILERGKNQLNIQFPGLTVRPFQPQNASHIAGECHTSPLSGKTAKTSRSCPGSQMPRRPKDPRWIESAPKNFKFIDNGIHLVKINIRLMQYQLDKPIKCAQDAASQAMFNHFVSETDKRGRRVNASKTALICFSDATSFEANAIPKKTQTIMLQNWLNK